MNISYSTDENYAVHTYISIKSLLNSNRECDEISFFIICNNLRVETINAFKELVNEFSSNSHHRTIHFLDFKNYEHLVKDANPCGSLSTYGRLFLEDYLPEIDRILYIDCDTLVLDSLEEFYNISLDNYAIAGVQDIVSFSKREPLGLTKNDRYINAGVSLLNLKYWRSKKGMLQCLKFIKKFDGKVPFEDQGTINGVFKNQILIVNPRFNFMNVFIKMSARKISLINDVDNYYSDEEVAEANKRPVIIHFTAGYYNRPWFKNSNHPYAKIYQKLRNDSPWHNVKLQKCNRKNFIPFCKHVFFRIASFNFLSKYYAKKRKMKN